MCQKFPSKSQRVLAKRAGVPQSTVSRIEKDSHKVTIVTLNKVLQALSCDLVMAPLLQCSTETLRKQQAKKRAEKQLDCLKGTMTLEEQQPDPRFIRSLSKLRGAPRIAFDPLFPF
jgi:transcriptional regulator with XRE-family HTH domain